MDRRDFAAMGALGLWAAARPALARQDDAPAPGAWPALEARVGGRLGVAVLDTGTGRLTGHRLTERFPMCSTFKWLAAGAVLQRVDAGQEQLERRLPVSESDLLDHSPFCRERVGGSASLAELCEATITLSDNAAANLILATFGGPSGVTAFARRVGDQVTRLDRTEPTLNEARPGDPRDTTSPAAMAGTLQAVVLGRALSPASRAQLAAWLVANTTGDRRLRAHAPTGWRVGDKTGTGARGTANDVAVAWPAGGGAPRVVTAFLTEAEKAAPADREAVLAEVGRLAWQG